MTPVLSAYYRQSRKRLRCYIDSFRTKCSMCGESSKCCLDFHHIDPKTKERRISYLRSIKKIDAEIAKCIVLCSNCHRKLHHNMRTSQT